MILTASNPSSYIHLMDSPNSLICGSAASPPAGPTPCVSPGSFHLLNIDTTDALTAAHQQLVQIWEDPRTRSVAKRHAGHLDCADDALQSAYHIVARLKNLDQIENLRAYFHKVLIREVYRERCQFGAALVDDFVRLAEAHRDENGLHAVGGRHPERAVGRPM